MRFDLVTLFPGFFESTLRYGILERALRSGLASVHVHDLRDWTHDRHRTVDDRPFGGGEGMVLKPQPIFECVESLGVAPKSSRLSDPAAARESVILLSAGGRRFTQSTARRVAALKRVVLICGRYEGVDERVSQLLCDDELSIGDFVLSGGELGAAIVVDATVRLVPGVLGHEDSSVYESFGLSDDSAAEDKTADGVPRSTYSSGGLLDYPHYTRPADFRGVSIPDVLSGGDHSAIRHWRRHAALARTLANRPDLLTGAELSDDDREFLSLLQQSATPEGSARS